MTGVLVDTNVLVSFLTDRDLTQQERAAALVEQAAEGHTEVVVPQVVLVELVFVLTNLYQVTAGQVASMIRQLLDLPGVRPLNELSWPAVLNLWPERVPAFADAALAATARRERLAVATFDRRLVRKLRAEEIAVAEL